MSTKRALISGVSGQDGAYLAHLLLLKGYRVFGTYRRSSTRNFWRLRYLGILDRIELLPADMSDGASLFSALLHAKPDEVYNLAAQSFVGTSFEEPVLTGNVDGLGTQRLLEAILKLCPTTKFYQACTSEMYGNANGQSLIDEKSPMVPASPYGAAKLYAYHTTRIYREAHGLFAVNGILFNHESPLRSLEFVTRKITNAAAMIHAGKAQYVSLGNIEARRDFGDARDYVYAMWCMLQHDEPEDFVVANGESCSIIDVVRTAFEFFGKDWRPYVLFDQSLVRPTDIAFLQGDAEKIRTKLGWSSGSTGLAVIHKMVEEDDRRWKDALQGKVFPWDVPSALLFKTSDYSRVC